VVAWSRPARAIAMDELQHGGGGRSHFVMRASRPRASACGSKRTRSQTPESESEGLRPPWRRLLPAEVVPMYRMHRVDQPGVQARNAPRCRVRWLSPPVPRHNARQPARRSSNPTELAAGGTKFPIRCRPGARRHSVQSARASLIRRPPCRLRSPRECGTSCLLP